MGWDKGRYYTRSKRVNGRVEREYLGSGQIGELAAQLDAESRKRERAANERERAIRASHDALTQQVVQVCEWADLMARAALVAAGYRQHHRGEWRRKREPFCD